MPNKKVHSLESLDKEINRLRQKAKNLEEKMDDNFSYLQEHSSALMINTLLSGFIIKNKESVSGSIFNFLLQSERFQKTLGKLSEVAVDKVANVIDTLINKISPDKD
jgi:hypothetical protein